MFTPSRYFGDPALHETAGLAALNGYYDHLSARVDVATGKVVDYQPPQPDTDHEWNPTTKRWVLNAAAVAHQNTMQAAKVRLGELAEQERPLMRRLLLDPTDAKSRAALTALDDEVNQLSKSLDPSAASGSGS